MAIHPSPKGKGLLAVVKIKNPYNLSFIDSYRDFLCLTYIIMIFIPIFCSLFRSSQSVAQFLFALRFDPPHRMIISYQPSWLR